MFGVFLLQTIVRQDGHSPTKLFSHPTISENKQKGPSYLGNFPLFFVVQTETASTQANQEESQSFQNPAMDSHSMYLTPFLTGFAMNSDIPNLHFYNHG